MLARREVIMWKRWRKKTKVSAHQKAAPRKSSSSHFMEHNLQAGRFRWSPVTRWCHTGKVHVYLWAGKPQSSRERTNGTNSECLCDGDPKSYSSGNGQSRRGLNTAIKAIPTVMLPHEISIFLKRWFYKTNLKNKLHVCMLPDTAPQWTEHPETWISPPQSRSPRDWGMKT